MKHRDRFFTLAFVTGNMVGIGFWCLLFPHKSAREAFLSSDRETILCLLQHGFTWIAINTEMFITHHRCCALPLYSASLNVYTTHAWCVLVLPCGGKQVRPLVRGVPHRRGLRCVLSRLEYLGSCRDWGLGLSLDPGTAAKS